MIIGLTGHSGSGKSIVAEMFSGNGYYLIDCDKISRSLDNNPEYQEQIRKSFGDQVFDGDEISRKKLGAVVFGDKSKLQLLTQISHPIIGNEILSKISEHLQEDIVIDAPLLFEAGLEKYCDITIGIVADDDIRAYRVSQRDNLDIEEARVRIMSQKDKQFYIDKCNYIIENNSSLGVLEANFKELSKIIGE